MGKEEAPSKPKSMTRGLDGASRQSPFPTRKQDFLLIPSQPTARPSNQKDGVWTATRGTGREWGYRQGTVSVVFKLRYLVTVFSSASCSGTDK